jgi:ABC-type multidrug transport system ATPase subunit
MTDPGGGYLLRARGLAKVYGRRAMVRASDGSDLLGVPGVQDEEQRVVRAVDGVDLDVRAGEVVAVMGPSGCGKSTLLHLLGGLDRPTGGQVWLAGQRIDTLSERALARMRRTSIGFVFQASHLMEELTAAENVELPALLRHQPAGSEAAGGRAAWAGCAGRPGQASAFRAVGRAAPAGRDRPRLEQRAPDRAG